MFLCNQKSSNILVHTTVYDSMQQLKFYTGYNFQIIMQHVIKSIIYSLF